MKILLVSPLLGEKGQAPGGLPDISPVTGYLAGRINQIRPDTNVFLPHAKIVYFDSEKGKAELTGFADCLPRSLMSAAWQVAFLRCQII